jgi:hypothetical protein
MTSNASEQNFAADAGHDVTTHPHLPGGVSGNMNLAEPSQASSLRGDVLRRRQTIRN